MQNYKNHIRFYIPHHFVLYPVLGVLGGLSFYYSFNPPGEQMLWIIIGLQFIVLVWMAFMMRNHYALNNQNRIVRLEMRFRYYVLTGKRFEPIENKLTPGHIYALRYAPDDELPALVDRTLNEHLTPDQVKRAIKNWMPDEMRA